MERTLRINNTEWTLFLIALGIIDLFQFGVEQIAIWFSLGALLAITEPLNIIIDSGVAILIPLYLRLRQQKVTKPGQIGGLLGTYLLEMVPGMDELPLWILDGFWYMYTIKKGYAEEDAAIAKQEAEEAAAQQNTTNMYAEEEVEEEQEEEIAEEEEQEERGNAEQTRIRNEEEERNKLEEQAKMEQLRNVVDINKYRKIKNTQSGDSAMNSENDSETQLAA